jgi:hypothetical protein
VIYYLGKLHLSPPRFSQTAKTPPLVYKWTLTSLIFFIKITNTPLSLNIICLTSMSTVIVFLINNNKTVTLFSVLKNLCSEKNKFLL